MNAHQDAFQIFLGIQKLNHMQHNKLLIHYFLRVYSQLFCVISAYKDPVENQITKSKFSEFPSIFKDSVFACEH